MSESTQPNEESTAKVKEDVVPKPPLPSALPRPVPKPAPAAPSAPTAPAGDTAAAVTSEAPVVAPHIENPEDASKAAEFGIVEEDGTVKVREGDSERVVGQFPGVERDEALDLYVRRFLELQAKVNLFEARLEHADLGIGEIDQTLTKLTEELTEPAAVGDLVALRSRLDGLRTRAAERRSEIEAARQAAKAKALEERTDIVDRAEAVIAVDPAKRQWRPSGEKLRALLDEWKAHQKSSIKLDRGSEDALWKRFSAARTTFDRERRQYFAQLEQERSSIRQVKESIVSRAEEISGSTDWVTTARTYRDLMQEWKNAGRLGRKDEDALWTRFRAAQDAFFNAKKAADELSDAEHQENLAAKLTLLDEAETILPVKDLDAARAALRGIQDRWEAIGKVPRADLSKIEGRLRAVERAVKQAEDDAWRRSNPETRARVEGAAAQLEASIAALEQELADAKKAKDKKQVAEVEAALEARRAWLDQITSD